MSYCDVYLGFLLLCRLIVIQATIPRRPLPYPTRPNCVDPSVCGRSTKIQLPIHCASERLKPSTKYRGDVCLTSCLQSKSHSVSHTVRHRRICLFCLFYALVKFLAPVIRRQKFSKKNEYATITRPTSRQTRRREKRLNKQSNDT